MLERVLSVGAPSPFRVRLDHDPHPALFMTNATNRHCVITTGTYDLLEAAPEARRRQVLLLEQLLAGIEGSFQLHVGSRPAPPSTSGRERLSSFLDGPGGGSDTFTREVSLVLSDAWPAVTRLASRWEALRRRAGWPHPAEGVAGAVLAEAAAVSRALQLMGLAPQLLEGWALDRFLDERLPPSLARGFDADWREEATTLHVDEALSRTFLLDAYPGLELEAGWLAQLLDTPAVYDLAVHGFRVPTASAMRVLSGRIRALQATRLSDLASQSAGDPLAEAGLPEALGLRREVASNQQHVFAVSVYITLEAAGADDLATASAALLDRASRTMARMLPATFQMAAGRVATLPLGEDPLGHHRLLPGGVVATLYPWLWDELQQPRGHFVGRRLRGGSPVLLDTFDDAVFSNANVGVFGHSGAGKTYLMKGLLLSDADAGIGAS